jgi:hypothetical protein
MNTNIHNGFVYKAISLLLASIVALSGFAYSVSASVTPDMVDTSIVYGEYLEVDKEVTTPVIPLDPEICLLADTTGSMGGALANVQANASAAMASIVAAQPGSEFCVAQYRDFGDVPVFSVDQDLTNSIAAADAAIGTWSAGGGGDFPEGQLNALHLLATGAATYDGPNRIIVWFGDAPGHDPSGGSTLASTIADLNAANITVIAIAVAAGFDSTGQASAIAAGTGGVFLNAATPDDVVDAILEGLEALTTDVTYEVGECSEGLSVTLTPDVQEGIVGGGTAEFLETIAVADDSNLQGTDLHCEVHFMDTSGGDLGTEEIWISVPDTTSPEIACTEDVNPHGKTTPPAGSTTLPGSKGGMNEDGFYLLSASDNLTDPLDIWVNGFGPFADGDIVKVTEDSDATPESKSMGSKDSGGKGQADAVAAHLILNTDPTLTTTDDSGNSAEATCYVPAPPK